MNYSDYKRNSRLRLVSRNEGKLKSYESCFDLRAWSHDVQERGQYLREWVKTDMPVCVIPISTLAKFLCNMTYKNRGKITPRCHPNCKSKVILESICTSCDAMKECLHNQEEFEKFFEEEEFETSTWPCERCLDALKSIKMFWKVIVEKVFRIRVPKAEEPCNPCSCADSVRTVRTTAKTWEAEMINQAWLVRKLSQGEPIGEIHHHTCKRPKSAKFDSPFSCSTCKLEGLSYSKMRNAHSVRSYRTKPRDNDSIPLIAGNRPHRHRKVSRSISVRVKNSDVACETCDVQRDSEECGAYKNDFHYLQQRYNILKAEMEKMKRENNSLKLELHNYYNGFSLNSHLCTPAGMTPANKALCVLPKPFDCAEDVSTEHSIKSADSEVIITMKNCRNTDYKNVSLLQVLHKSNEPVGHTPAGCSCKKEDPVDLLIKMQNVFGSIVRREIGIVNDKRRSRTKISEINASFHKVKASRSDPSYTCFDSKSRTSFIHCVCTKDVK